MAKELLKKIGEEGDIIFLRSKDDQIPFGGEESIDEVFDVCIDRFESLLNLLHDDEWSKFGYILRAIIDDSKTKFKTLDMMIEKSIGKIYLFRPTLSLDVYGLRFIPRGGVGEFLKLSK